MACGDLVGPRGVAQEGGTHGLVSCVYGHLYIHITYSIYR